ncbi:S8 family serine peptidase [bacterium]|nr:S8 family serine peptidase [bacterium]
MNKHILLYFFITPSFLATTLPKELNLDDGTGIKTFSVITNPTKKYSKYKDYSIILHPKGKLPTPENRRFATERVHVRMDNSVTPAEIAKASHATSFKVPHYSTNDLILTFPQPADTITELEKIHKLAGVEYARPLLAKLNFRKSIPNDPRFAWSRSNPNYLWHLRNTGQNGSVTGIDANITDVWDNYRGRNITISVVDDGVQVDHEDLIANINTTIDHDWNDNTPNDPSPENSAFSDDTHGTSVAGVIAARGNNEIGVTGAAPEASIVGLRILSAPTSGDIKAAALAWRTDLIDISNNSWGAPDTGETAFKIDPLVSAALTHGVRNGRQGKGTIYVWSAGNGRTDGDYANLDGYVNQPETIGIGAINYRGTSSYYSEYGSNIVISAPSDNRGNDPSITTTTLTADGTYTDNFGGTSSAAPLVSGVIALILEANPNLGWRDIQEILIRSARKVDAGSSGWVNNGAGFHFHHGYGAGMIDAKAAVNLAKQWTNLEQQTSSNHSPPSINKNIPDNNLNGVIHTFNVTDNELRVEQVILTLDVDHTYLGDLYITLTSPDGTISILNDLSGGSQNGYDDYHLLSVRHWGEKSNGTWTLKISDRVDGDTGTLRNASLKIFGVEYSGGGPIIADGKYLDWVKEHFPLAEQTNFAIAGETADPDKDGRPNLIEYAFDGNPKAPEARLRGEPRVINENGLLKIQFRVNTSNSDIRYLLVHAPSLKGPFSLARSKRISTRGNIETHQLIPDQSRYRQRFYRALILRK